MALPKLEGVYTVGDSESVDVTETGGGGGPISVALTAGDYSLTELLTHLADVLTSNGTLTGTYSASVSDGSDTATGVVTISVTGITSFVLEWDTATGTRDALGYADDLTPTATSFASPGSSPFIWLPNTGRSDAKGADGGRGEPVRSVAVNVATSGATYSWASASLRYEDVLEWMGLKGYKTIAALEVTANESLQTFFINVISKGLEFRYHADRSDDDTYTQHVAKQPSAERLGVTPRIKAWRGAQSLWDWRCEAYAPGAAASEAVWSPLDLSPLLWLRSDLGVSITGSGVSTWADQSGNGNDATQATDSRRPTYATAQINGHQALTWSDSAQSQLGLAGVTVPTNASVIAVSKLTSGKTSYRLLIQGAASASDPDVYIQGEQGATDYPSLYWSAAFKNDGATAVNDGTWRALRWMWGTTNLAIAYNNGSDQTAARSGLTVAGAWDQIGTGSDTFHLFDGQIAELIIVGSEMTSGEIASLNSYLSTRYAIW